MPEPIPGLDGSARAESWPERAERWISRATRCARPAGLVLLALLLWITKVNTGVPLNHGRSDGSWCWLVIDAVIHGRQFGPEVIWTYGPIGAFNAGLWVSEFEPLRMWIWEVGFKLVIAACTVAAMLRLRGTLSRVLFAATYVLIPIEGNVWGMLAVMVVAVLLFDHLARPWVQLVACAPLAVLALEKTTGLVTCNLVVGIGIAVLLVGRDLRGAGRLLGAWIAWLSIVWLACGQSLWNFPLWAWRSLELADAYSEAMSLDGPPELVFDGRLSIALAAAMCAACLVAGTARLRDPLARARRAREIGSVLVWAAGVFTAYKAGFVRAADHPMIYFLAAPPLAYLLVEPAGARVWPVRILALLRHGMALHAFVTALLLLQPGPLSLHTRIAQISVQSSLCLSHVLDPDVLRAEVEPQVEAARKTFAVPLIAEHVGTEPIDVVPCQHGVAVLSGIAIHARPMIQSYAAFTPSVARMNARFFEGESAPRFVMLELFSLDFTPPMCDDYAALQVLAREYTPVLCEKEDVLLERLAVSQRKPAGTRKRVLERTIGVRESVELQGLEGACHLLALDVRYSLAGRLRKALDQAPPLFAILTTNDGRIQRVRVVPGMVREGFIADPWIETNADWVKWRAAQPVARPVRIEIEPSPAAWMYDDEIGIAYIDASDLAPDRSLVPPSVLRGSMIESEPDRVVPDTARVVTFPDARAQRVEVPSTMTFAIPAGHLRLQCFHGLMPRCYLKHKSDGAGFSARLVRDGVVLATPYLRVLDPRRNESDRGHVQVDVEFDVDAPCELELCTDGGPSGDTTDDWTYWGTVRITDVQGDVVPGWAQR